MGNKGRPSVNKRRKEEARRLRKKAKVEKFAARAEGKKEDPNDSLDVSWITPGPQALPEEMRDPDDAPPEEAEDGEENESEERG